MPRTPPAGFLVYDNPATPEVDGAATDPRKVGHTASYFACDVQADPPTPAESGIVAVSNIVFEEGTETLPLRVRDHRTITVAYLDDVARTRIGQELRERIGGCRSQVPAAFTALRFSLTEVPVADETVGYTFELPPDAGPAEHAAADRVLRDRPGRCRGRPRVRADQQQPGAAGHRAGGHHPGHGGTGAAAGPRPAGVSYSRQGSGFSAGSGGSRRRLAKNGRDWRNASDHTSNVWPSPGITTEQVATPAARASGTSCWMAW